MNGARGALAWAVAPGVDRDTLYTQEDDIDPGHMVFIVADFRTVPAEHLWVRDAQVVPVQDCAVCGDPAVMKVMTVGVGSPGREFYVHRGESGFHMVPAEDFVQRVIGDDLE